MAKLDKSIRCSRCDNDGMIRGYLKAEGDIVHVYSLQSLRDSVLHAMICPKCGYVELQAESPKDLTHRDFSAKEIKDIFGE